MEITALNENVKVLKRQLNFKYIGATVSQFENNVSIFDTVPGKRCHLNKKLKNYNHNPNF